MLFYGTRERFIAYVIDYTVYRAELYVWFQTLRPCYATCAQFSLYSYRIDNCQFGESTKKDVAAFLQYFSPGLCSSEACLRIKIFLVEPLFVALA